ncbi:hypothetical protein [uncultured Roseobacter sp.]|uniref:hypothetical protein n=1 Tax=uncultured Roseobacter sp. TaxID=114847 RepID=UPI002624563A|nr:hypothetical protein [uncultured Roseobacter sp.]
MITQAELQGHWRRGWIKAPGFEDHTTRVHWLQAGALFVDLRVPLDRPQLGTARCLADLPHSILAELMLAEGFAGHTTLEKDRCTWHREINWHGQTDTPDIGQLSRDGKTLIEDGVLADFREQWLRQETSGLRAHRIRTGTQQGVLIENDVTFAIGLGTAPLPRRSTDLIAALKAGTAQTPDIRRHFDSIYCLGEWDGPHGRAVLSTNPFCEGQLVLQRGEGLTWHAPGFDGDGADSPLHITGETMPQ